MTTVQVDVNVLISWYFAIDGLRQQLASGGGDNIPYLIGEMEQAQAAIVQVLGFNPNNQT